MNRKNKSVPEPDQPVKKRSLWDNRLFLLVASLLCAIISWSIVTLTFDSEGAREFFAAQDFTAAAVEDGRVLGLYILHPNNVGRCGHQANASYAVSGAARGRGLGGALVRHSLGRARELGYRLLIFNAVVENNARARALYERLGYRPLEYLQMVKENGGF